MTGVWEAAFTKNQLMWGHEPARSALYAKDVFVSAGARSVLVPGVGYGRNAKVFIDEGMDVTGIEISETAIGLARSQLGLTFPIHQGSVTDMPFDERQYDGIFCYGLLYLLDAAGREKVIRDAHRQLAPGGHMIFTLIAKEAPMYGRGTKLGEDWFEVHPGIPMYFYDADSIVRDFGRFGLVEQVAIEEAPLPFLNAVCKKA
jgi:SAM-dependent methyltransferase